MSLFPHLPKDPAPALSRGTRAGKMVSIMVVCWVATGSLLAACGSNTGTQQAPASRYGTAPTATRSIQTPTPTPVPPTPTPTAAPSQAAPAVLDLRPASMSFVGHLDCPGKAAYVCTARVISGSGNQSNLHWHAFTNIPGHISFSPLSGVLAPGTSVLVRITIPFGGCTHGLFFFQGPINTHTITWAC